MRRAGLSEVLQRHLIQLGRVKLASGARSERRERRAYAFGTAESEGR
jgi:hypothetical protein